jgi:hypothetical protein
MSCDWAAWVEPTNRHGIRPRSNRFMALNLPECEVAVKRGVKGRVDPKWRSDHQLSAEREAPASKKAAHPHPTGSNLRVAQRRFPLCRVPLTNPFQLRLVQRAAPKSTQGRRRDAASLAIMPFSMISSRAAVDLQLTNRPRVSGAQNPASTGLSASHSGAKCSTGRVEIEERLNREFRSSGTPPCRRPALR